MKQFESGNNQGGSVKRVSGVLLVAAVLATTAHAQQPAAATEGGYPAGTVLVVAPKEYPFAGVEVGAAVPGGMVVEMSLLDAMKVAKGQSTVTGVVGIDLSTDSLVERGRVVCYSPAGKKLWEERVMFNMGGSADRIAEKFASRLASKVSGKACG